LLFHRRFIPGLAIHSYVIGDESSGEAAVVDPTRDVEEYIRYADENRLTIRHVLETHVHADFVSGSLELKSRLNGEPQIHCSGLGGDEWTPPSADHVVGDGDRIDMGKVRLQAVHTPGHTPEHVSWALYDTSRSADVPWLVFTGDFLFVGDVGRPDLLGDEARKTLAHQLYQSVFERLPALPDLTEVFPSHGAGSLCGKAIGSRSSSTVGYERRFNASLAQKPEAEWVAELLAGMPLAPPYFRRMKQVNREGPPLLGRDLPGNRRWKAAQVYERVCSHCLIVDARSKEAFSAAHIAGAINIPLGPHLPTWAGWVLPYDHPTLIILDNPAELPQVVTHLIRVGFDDLRGYLDGGMEAWQMGGFPFETLETVSVHQLKKRIERGDRLTLLDVRTEQEWSKGHLEGALHIHGGMLQERFAEVPRDRPVAIICGSGYRASIAGSFLKRDGYEAVMNVIGGMTAWKAAGMPVTTE
jgi:hydroxyacylglutathione hydrolase